MEFVEESVTPQLPDAVECQLNLACVSTCSIMPRLKISRLGNRLLEIDLFALDPDVPLMKYLVDPMRPLQRPFVTPPSFSITSKDGACLKAIGASCENARQFLRENDFKRAEKYAKKAVSLFLKLPFFNSECRSDTNQPEPESTVQIEELPDDEVAEANTKDFPMSSEKLPADMNDSTVKQQGGGATFAPDDDEMDIIEEFSRLSLKRSADDETFSRIARQKLE